MPEKFFPSSISVMGIFFSKPPFNEHIFKKWTEFNVHSPGLFLEISVELFSSIAIARSPEVNTGVN